MGHHDAAYIEAYVLELTAQTEHVLVVCDSEVAADLVLLYVLGTDNYNDFSLVLELLEHIKLAVRLEARQHTAGMIVVE